MNHLISKEICVFQLLIQRLLLSIQDVSVAFLLFGQVSFLSFLALLAEVYGFHFLFNWPRWLDCTGSIPILIGPAGHIVRVPSPILTGPAGHIVWVPSPF